MNSKSIKYRGDIDPGLEIAASPKKALIEAIFNQVAALFTAGHSGPSQAGYRARRARAVQADINQDIVRSLPIEEKLRLGMYRFMD
jgi:hypothetical protein